ncbi:MAG: hypothetical protein IIC50_23630, partial [Planctomycetes bacterium]|nr:hypothetical protein [Planctomycetota bacterium]
MSTKPFLLITFCVIVIPAGIVHAAFNTVGEYDVDDEPHHNQVDQSGLYESHQGNAGPENVVGLEVFRELVAAAFLIDAGGVIDLEDGSLDGQDMIGNFGLQGTKSLTISNATGIINVGSSVKNERRAISGSNRFAKSNTSEFVFDIGAITGGTPGERVTYVAATMLDRDGTALNPTVTATFSGGGTVTASAVMSGDLPVNDQDTFFGFVAPPGESIVNVTFTPNGYTNTDDIAFITSAFSLRSPNASKPFPGSEATDVSRDVMLHWTPGDDAETHDLYFGTDETAVAQASPVNPLGVLVSGNQEPSTYVPAGRLDFGATYYWRVDEINDLDPNSPWQGAVWSFMVEPVALPIIDITATASSTFGESGPERTIDGSGLADDLHGTSVDDMWLSTSVPATIEYAFD